MLLAIVPNTRALHNLSLLQNLSFFSLDFHTNINQFTIAFITIYEVNQLLVGIYGCIMDPREYDNDDDDYIDFNANELSANENLSFACTVSNAKISAAKLSRRHSMCDRTLQRYATLYENGCILHEKGGRPPAVLYLS